MPVVVVVVPVLMVLIVPMVVIMVVPMAVIVPMIAVAGMRATFGRHQEAPACEAGGIAVGHEPHLGARSETEGRHRIPHGGPVLRESVQQCRREHVARPSAERIQMNVQPRLRRPKP